MNDATWLRLALFTDTFAPQVNGVARTLERLAGAVRERGGEVMTFTTTDPDAIDDASVRRYGSVPFWAYPQLRLAAPSRGGVARALAQFRPTVVHAATPFGVGLAGRAAARALGVPFVTSYHTSFSAYARYYRLGVLSAPGWAFLRHFHNSGARTYCPSRAVGDELNAHGFTDVAIWSRGVDPSRFAPSFRSAELRAEWGADNDTVVVGYVGRMAPEKGIADLLRAIPDVVARVGDRVRFVFVGDGPYEAACRAAAPPQTLFLGRRTGRDLSKAYASMDVFAFPSTTDTFGNVLLEAAASRLAIVAADAGPTRELLGDGAALLYTPGHAGAFADALATAVVGDDLRALVAARAADVARRRTWGAIFDELVADYRTVAGSKARPRYATLFAAGDFHF